jgi:Flp pilus assembly pilin Flp
MSRTAATPNDSRLLGIAAGLVPIAAVVAVDPAGLNPFNVAKWWSVLAVALGAAAVAAIAASAASARTNRQPQHPAAIERAVIALFGALVVVMAVSTITALDGLYAWIGTPIRNLGLLAWVVFGAMLLVGRRVGLDDKAQRSAVRGFVVAALALGLYCLVETAGGTPFVLDSNTSRLVGPFGSAAYLGAACCLLLPVSVGVAADALETRRWRIIAAASSLLLAVAVIGSGSRAAIVGLTAAGIAIVIAQRAHLRQHWNDVSGQLRQRTRWGFAAAGAAVGIAGLVAIRAGVFERTAGFASRVDDWKVGLRVVADHPVIGVGPEGYRLVVNGFLDAEYVRRYGEATTIDRAHSGVLDVAISSGVIAAVIYLALLGTVGWSAARLARSASAVEVGIAGAVLAYIVQQQLFFPIAELDPMLWLLAGIIVVKARSTAPQPRTTPLRSRSRHRMATTTMATTAMAVVLGIAAAGAVVVGALAVAADRHAHDTLRTADVAVAIDSAQAAVARSPFDVRHRLLLAYANLQEQTLEGADRALVAVDDALAIAPLDPVAAYQRAILLSWRAATTGSTGDRLAAKSAWEQEIEAAPYCARCHFNAGRVALDSGDTDAAIASLTIAAYLGADGALELLESIQPT